MEVKLQGKSLKNNKTFNKVYLSPKALIPHNWDLNESRQKLKRKNSQYPNI